MVVTENNKTQVTTKPVNPFSYTDEIPNADTIAAINELKSGCGHNFSGTVDEFFSMLDSLPDDD